MGSKSIPASSLFTQDMFQQLQIQEEAGGAAATFVLLLPHHCAEQRVCGDFVEFWADLLAGYSAHAFFGVCGAIANEAGKICGPEVSDPSIVQWSSEGFKQYDGGRTFPAVINRVCEAVWGPAACSPDYAWAKQYTSQEDWFTQNVPQWSKWFAELVGTPANLLEIGTFEGLATCWLVDHVLTHPDARITTVDPYMRTSEVDTFVSDAAAQANFEANRARSKFPEKVTSFVGTSADYFDSLDRKEERGTFDAIYIDGSHMAADVLFDAVTCWGLLKPGGIIIFDDYNDRYSPTHTQVQSAYSTPKLAIDSFIGCFKPYLEVVAGAGGDLKQLVIRKKAADEIIL